jgi:hypothetical protein
MFAAATKLPPPISLVQAAVKLSDGDNRGKTLSTGQGQSSAGLEMDVIASKHRATTTRPRRRGGHKKRQTPSSPSPSSS